VQLYWPLTAQKVPNRATVKPPEDGQKKFHEFGPVEDLEDP